MTETTKKKAREVDTSLTILEADKASDIAEALALRGDISSLSPEARAKYVVALCRSLGLNPLTQPIEFIPKKGGGGLVPYVSKKATDQLRLMHKVSIEIVRQERVGKTFIVQVRATTPDGRVDEDVAALELADKYGDLKGQDLADAMMKCITKAKRRVTLSICGIGLLTQDEAEDMSSDAVPRRQVLRRYEEVKTLGVPTRFLDKTPYEAIQEAQSQADLAEVATWLAAYQFEDDQVRDAVQEAFTARMQELAS